MKYSLVGITILMFALTGLPQEVSGLIYAGIPREQFDSVAAAQQMDEWCWAASVQMILQYYGIPVTQQEIVDRVFGESVDLGANEQIISEALNGWAFTANGQRVIIRSAWAAGPPPPTVLVREMSLRHPMLFTFVKGPSTGHAIVVTAVGYNNTPAGPYVQNLIFRDPSPTPENIAAAGRVELAGPDLAQFLPLIRSNFIISVQPAP
jgi:hypothetical protein